jgi:predicted DNA-binding WGR domain protein
MSAITLHRRDPAKNMQRYYRLDVQPDLFGAWCFIREWGREGRSGQVRQVPYPTPDEAQAALERQRGAKLRRGYAHRS